MHCKFSVLCILRAVSQYSASPYAQWDFPPDPPKGPSVFKKIWRVIVFLLVMAVPVALVVSIVSLMATETAEKRSLSEFGSQSTAQVTSHYSEEIQRRKGLVTYYFIDYSYQTSSGTTAEESRYELPEDKWKEASVGTKFPVTYLEAGTLTPQSPAMNEPTDQLKVFNFATRGVPVIVSGLAFIALMLVALFVVLSLVARARDRRPPAYGAATASTPTTSTMSGAMLALMVIGAIAGIVALILLSMMVAGPLATTALERILL